MHEPLKPLRAALFLVGSVGFVVLGLATTQAQPVSDTPPKETVKQRMQFAPQTGYDAEVVALEGIGTTKATASILLDFDQEIHECAAQFFDNPAPNPDANARCIALARESFTEPKILTTKANCQTGEMFGFGENISRFYVGRDSSTYEYMGKQISAFNDYFDYEGFRVPGYSQTNTSVDGKIFRKLCPNSFLGPPKTHPPELHLSINCNATIAEAEQIATQAGFQHLLNVKIIDAWDIKSETQNWHEAKCSAKIALNMGEDARLDFRVVPRHGSYFLEARIVH